MILLSLTAMTLSGCGTSGSKGILAPKLIEANTSCPMLPSDIRREAKRYTDIPVEQLTKPQVLDLFRQYATSEVKKNYTIKRVADLYDACVATLK